MRVVRALVVVALAASGAAADVKRDIQIESEPPGADVYLESKDAGSLCKTPCTIKAPVGETVLILEIENHLPALESLVVPRRGKVAPARFKLTRAVGTIDVKGPKGATIRVGDTDRGKAPAKVEVDAGPQAITLILDGKQVLQDLIEVEANQEVVVRGEAPRTAAAAETDEGEDAIDAGDGDGDAEGAGDDTARGGEVEQKRLVRPRGPRAKRIALTAVVDVGFRRWTYDKVVVTDKPLGNEDEVGQVIAGPMLELWPGTLLGVRALRGLALVGRFQFPINKQPVRGEQIMTPVTTFWQSLEVSLRHRWTLSELGTVEVGAGYVRDQHQFNTEPSNIDLVPDADYRAIRIGVRGSLLVGALEPYLAVENRIVMSGGRVLEQRFDTGANATGMRAALGANAQFGPVAMKLEAVVTRYAWTFKYENASLFKAAGATDLIFAISAGLGFAY